MDHILLHRSGKGDHMSCYSAKADGSFSITSIGHIWGQRYSVGRKIYLGEEDVILFLTMKIMSNNVLLWVFCDDHYHFCPPTLADHRNDNEKVGSF